MTDETTFDRIATDLGLPRSRLIDLSKSDYQGRHPDNAVVFNATIADAMGARLWWGDVDLTVDEPKLVELAEQIGIDLYLYFEGDSRTGFVTSINPATAVVYISDEGLVSLGSRVPLMRDAAGRIVRDRRDPFEPSGGFADHSTE